MVVQQTHQEKNGSTQHATGHGRDDVIGLSTWAACNKYPNNNMVAADSVPRALIARGHPSLRWIRVQGEPREASTPSTATPVSRRVQLRTDPEQSQEGALNAGVKRGVGQGAR